MLPATLYTGYCLLELYNHKLTVKAEVASTHNSQAWNLWAITSKLVGNFLTGSVNEEHVFVL